MKIEVLYIWLCRISKHLLFEAYGNMRWRNPPLTVSNISSLFKSRFSLCRSLCPRSSLVREYARPPGIPDFERGSLIPWNYVTFNVKKSATWLWPTAVASGKYARNPCLPSLSRRETAPTSVPGVCMHIHRGYPRQRLRERDSYSP